MPNQTPNLKIKTKPSKIMDTLANLGWIKFFNPAIKGQFHFLPRGTIVFNAMSQFLKNWVAKELNAMEIRTPHIYDFNDPSIQAESAQFADRLFQVNTDDHLGILRPGGDYGVMSILANQKLLNEKHFPIALFELAHSYRKNQTRELSGLLRANAFTLLDSHFFLANESDAWDWYIEIILAGAKLANYFKINYEFKLDIQTEFYNDNISHLLKLKEKLHDFTINEIANLKNYWTMQHYFTDVDDQIGFCDGQYDLVNAKNYNITYQTQDGKTRLNPVICHASFGSVERWIFKLVLQAISSQGYTFPLWLCPSHIRFICENKNFDFSAIMNDAHFRNIRVEIDNRNKSIIDKINAAKTEWVPYSIVIKDNLNDVTVYDLKGNNEKSSLLKIFEEVETKIKLASISALVNLDAVIRNPILR